MAKALQNVDVDHLKDLHRGMARIRAFEEAGLDALKQGLVLGAIHPSIGQEAVAVGLCGQLRQDDILLSTHRGHGHTLAKGADARAMMAELFGRKGGTCGGKGGSMHIADFEVGMLGANGVVAANIPIAAGAAHAIKLQGGDRVTVCIFGDGAINRGPFMEGLNWARVFDLPILYVCEDNGFAATTRTEDLTGGAGPAARAESLGLSAHKVDGNDVLAVEDIGRDLIARIRAGEGPQFLVAETYRLTGHTGADPATYRPDAEVEAAKTRDPLARTAGWLLEAGLPAADIDRIKQEADAEMKAAVSTAGAAPWPEAEAAYLDVQDIGAVRREPAHG